jgi:hypothetical protein
VVGVGWKDRVLERRERERERERENGEGDTRTYK